MTKEYGFIVFNKKYSEKYIHLLIFNTDFPKGSSDKLFPEVWTEKSILEG